MKYLCYDRLLLRSLLASNQCMKLRDA